MGANLGKPRRIINPPNFRQQAIAVTVHHVADERFRTLGRTTCGGGNYQRALPNGHQPCISGSLDAGCAWLAISHCETGTHKKTTGSICWGCKRGLRQALDLYCPVAFCHSSLNSRLSNHHYTPHTALTFRSNGRYGCKRGPAPAYRGASGEPWSPTHRHMRLTNRSAYKMSNT